MKGQPRLKAIALNTGGIKKGGVVDNHGGINHRVLYGGYGVIWLADFRADFVPVIW